MKALILVDLQNDFFPGGALGVKGGDRILPSIQALMKLDWDVVVASKDWHPSNHGSFAASHGKKVGEKVILDQIEQILWPEHCVQGSLGAEFAPGWDNKKIERVFYKGTEKEIDSYSTFFDNERKKNTGLGDFLNQRKITDVYLAGLTTEYCIKYSTFDALDLGFNVFVVEDACQALNLSQGDGEKALNEMKKQGAHIIKLQELKEKWRTQKQLS